MDFLLSTHDWYIKKTNKQSVLECSDIAGKKKQRSPDVVNKLQRGKNPGLFL